MKILAYILLILTLCFSCKEDNANFDINKLPILDFNIDTLSSSIIDTITFREKNDNLALVFVGEQLGIELISIDNFNNNDTLEINSGEEWIAFYCNDSTFETNTEIISWDTLQNIEYLSDTLIQPKFYIKNLGYYTSKGKIETVIWNELPNQIASKYSHFENPEISFSGDINNDGIVDYIINDMYHHEAVRISLFLSNGKSNWVKKCIHHFWV